MTEGSSKDGRPALMRQGVLSRVAKSIRAHEQGRTERVVLPALCLLVGLPLMTQLDHQGNPGRGYVGAIFISVLMVLGWAQRRYKSRVWYWLVILGLAVLHAAIWLLVPPHWDLPRGAISLIGCGDFLGAWAAFVLCERVLNRGNRSSVGDVHPGA